MKDTRNGENMDYNNTITENYNEVPGPNKANALQITGLVLSIVGIVVCCCLACGGLVLGIAGLVCSIKISRSPGRRGRIAGRCWPGSPPNRSPAGRMRASAAGLRPDRSLRRSPGWLKSSGWSSILRSWAGPYCPRC